MPSVAVSDDDIENGAVSIIKLMVKAGMAKSNGEAKKLIQQGGVSLNGEKIGDIYASLPAEQLSSGEDIILKKGKKVFYKVVKE